MELAPPTTVVIMEVYVQQHLLGLGYKTFSKIIGCSQALRIARLLFSYSLFFNKNLQ